MPPRNPQAAAELKRDPGDPYLTGKGTRQEAKRDPHDLLSRRVKHKGKMKVKPKGPPWLMKKAKKPAKSLPPWLKGK